MLDRLLTPVLRPLLTVLGVAGLLALGACGGGNGAPNNPFDTPPITPPLVVAPASLAAYSGVPTTATITSGVAPFFAFSANQSQLPVTQNVAGNTIVLVAGQVTAVSQVAVTIKDSAGQSATLNVSVTPAPIFNAMTFAPSSGDCGTNLCSGQDGTVTVVATGPGGAPLVARPIRFDVVTGPVGLQTTNPATPLVQTLTLVTDSSGTAVATIQALVNATTQPGQIRATDVTSGQQQISNFTVVNNTTAQGSPLAVIPPTATITTALAGVCSTGFRIDYYIYGGNPPYTVSSTFPPSVVLQNPTVNFSGGFFEAITNGSCVNPLVFTIVDSAGKQVTAQLINQAGAGQPPAPSPLAVAPPTVTDTGCGGKTYSFIVSGGTPPYNISQVTNPGYGGGVSVSPQVVNGAGGTFAVTYGAGTVAAGTNTSIIVIDGATPATTTTAKITCN
jgi:hypothetical protein